MRCLQVVAGDGSVRLGVLGEEWVRVLTRPHEHVTTTLDLLDAVDGRGLDAGSWHRSAEAAGAFEDVRWTDLAAGRSPVRLTVPLTPPEVWGAGVTYRRSADFREEGTGISCAEIGELSNPVVGI